MRNASIYRLVRLCVFVCIGAVFGGCASGEKEIIDVQFFHSEICASCETYKTAMSISNELMVLAREKRNLHVKILNMVDPASRPKLKEQLKIRGLPDVSLSIPIILIDNAYYSGYEKILEAIEDLEEL